MVSSTPIAFPGSKPEETTASTCNAPGQPAMQRYRRDIAYGANDGIVTTLVVVGSVTGGACRSLSSDRPWLVAGLEMLVPGTVASAVAYGIGFAAAALVN